MKKTLAIGPSNDGKSDSKPGYTPKYFTTFKLANEDKDFDLGGFEKSLISDALKIATLANLLVFPVSGFSAVDFLAKFEAYLKRRHDNRFHEYIHLGPALYNHLHFFSRADIRRKFKDIITQAVKG